MVFSQFKNIYRYAARGSATTNIHPCPTIDECYNAPFEKKYNLLFEKCYNAPMGNI